MRRWLRKRKGSGWETRRVETPRALAEKRHEELAAAKELAMQQRLQPHPDHAGRAALDDWTQWVQRGQTLHRSFL